MEIFSCGTKVAWGKNNIYSFALFKGKYGMVNIIVGIGQTVVLIYMRLLLVNTGRFRHD